MPFTQHIPTTNGDSRKMAFTDGSVTDLNGIPALLKKKANKIIMPVFSTGGPEAIEDIGPVVTQQLHSPAEPPGGGHVEGGQPVQLVLVIHPGPGLHQQPRSVQVTPGTRQVESRATSLGGRRERL